MRIVLYVCAASILFGACSGLYALTFAPDCEHGCMDGDQ